MMPKLPPWARPPAPVAPPPAPEPRYRRAAAASLEEIQRSTETTFPDVRTALLSAFGLEAAGAPTKISSVWASIRQQSGRVPSSHGLTHGLLVIQTSYTLRLAKASLDPEQWQVVLAYHTHRVPGARRLNQRKIYALYLALEAARAQACWCPRPFASAAALEWARWREPRYTNVEWAQRYDVTPTTVARWRDGQHSARGHKPGIVRVLNAHLAAAEGALEAPMREVGLIP